MKKITLLSFCFLSLGFLNAQDKTISLEDIFKNGTFNSKGVYGLESMNDGTHYTTLKNGKIERFSYVDPLADEVILDQTALNTASYDVAIDDYQFSQDESKLLISFNQEHIYRHSTRENYVVYDIKTKKSSPVGKEKAMYGSFSPDGKMLAYIRDNNLYELDLASGKETAITNDGSINAIINGATDWVHEEEFAFSVAYFWSPDSKKIAYYKFDERNVREFSFNEFNQQLYPSEYKFKYPKAGEENSVVTIHVADLTSGKTVTVDIGNETDQYIPRVKWTQDPSVLSFVRMNRHQNFLELFLADANTGKSHVVYSEKNDTYIDIHESEGDYVYFTKDKKGFILMSEQDGFNHLYNYDMNGQLLHQITKGNWDVVSYKGYDEKTKRLFYTASESTPTEKDIYSVKIDGSGKKMISSGAGVHDPEFSKGMQYFIDTYSTANTPNFIAVYNADGKQLRVLEDNHILKEKMAGYKLAKKEFFQFKNSVGIDLNGWIMKPVNMDPNKKYPVLLTFYGGPGRNMVNNSFDGSGYFWHQLLLQKGYIVVCVDNRGTQYRGKAFKACTYKQLGKLELEDQISTAKYLSGLPFVDPARIGTWGWSFGGYLSSLCITKGADYFKTAIAVAPVTNWRYYDNIYTERFMGLPQENPTGYDDNSPINHVREMSGKYLLIHGSGDDNVHFQNTMEMITALVNANKQFDLFIYPDKNHNISGGNTRLHLYTKMTNFILQNL